MEKIRLLLYLVQGKMNNASKKKQKIYSVALIGAGRIAAGFDAPKSRSVLTHAHAVVSSHRLKLAGITDTDEARGMREARKWKTSFYGSHDEMLKQTKPDIVVIATPDQTHTNILLRVLRECPRLVICEKPISSNKADIPKIRDAVRKSKIPVIVNLNRRFDPTVRAVQSDIRRGRFGKIISASAHYTRGLLHNGVHAIDLARFFFGDMTSANMHFSVNDFPGGVPSVGGVATFDRCAQFYLIAGDGRHFPIFEFEILLQRKRLRFVSEGLFLISQDVIPDPVFKGNRTLGKEVVRRTGLLRSMSLLMKNALAVLDGKETPISTLEEALRTESTCFKLSEGL